MQEGKHLQNAEDNQGNSVHVQWQIGESEHRAVFLQEGLKEGIVVSFTCPRLERRKVGIIMGASGEYVRAHLHRALGAICA